MFYLRIEILLRSMFDIMPNSLLRALMHIFSKGVVDYRITALLTHDQLVDQIIRGLKYAWNHVTFKWVFVFLLQNQIQHYVWQLYAGYRGLVITHNHYSHPRIRWYMHFLNFLRNIAFGTVRRMYNQRLGRMVHNYGVRSTFNLMLWIFRRFRR